ncbi:MAG: hypothetical protein GC162_20865 [Planctomycetes bacterium]|nr:hypothetical protein [Planctomycetota bacterium]
MKHKFTFLVGLIVALVFVFYMITFKVDFNEAVVVTTFGKAGESSIYRGDAEQGGLLGNLHLKWPWPVQQTRPYDLRVQLLEERLEEQQTFDKQSIVVSTFVAWRITDPLEFYRTLGNVDEAQKQIRAKLRDARTVLNSYTFDDLTNIDPAKLKLDEAENKIRQRIEQTTDQQHLGVAIDTVGIRRIILPQPVAEKVFNHMRKTREALAARAVGEGKAEKESIESEADNAAKRIMAFADGRAQALRAEGDAAATEFYSVFKKNEPFAIFLRWNETAREVLKHNSTFLIDAKEGLFQGLFTPPTGDTATNPAAPSSEK